MIEPMLELAPAMPFACHAIAGVVLILGVTLGTQHLYPELGVDLSERTYGVDCRLWMPGRGVNWPIIRATVFDEFVVAHTLGWWAKVWRESAQQVFKQGIMQLRERA